MFFQFHSLRRIFSDSKGNAAVEFALSVPVLLLLLMAMVDGGRLALANLKLYNAASSLADLASRDKTLSLARVNDMFAATQHILRPFTLNADGRVILTAVSADAPDQPRVFWQVAGGGTYNATSAIGTLNNPAQLPPSLVLAPQETVIVAEVFFVYHPLFGNALLADRLVYQSAYFRPRLGSLRSLE